MCATRLRSGEVTERLAPLRRKVKLLYKNSIFQGNRPTIVPSARGEAGAILRAILFRSATVGCPGLESSGMPASAGVRLRLAKLQGAQVEATFSKHERPPRERGRTWSKVRSSVGRTAGALRVCGASGFGGASFHENAGTIPNLGPFPEARRWIVGGAPTE